MPVLSRKADAFQRALQGAPATDREVDSLLRTAGQVRSLGYAPAPDPAFVEALHDRLMTEARSLPAVTPAAARARAAGRAAARTTPVVVVVGHGLPRALAGAAASALLVGAIVGVASRQTLPGDSLYPVKTWLDNVAVQLAGNDFDRGQTFLAQGQEHISDARDLSDAQRSANVGEVNTALRQAIDSVRSGQRTLDRSYASTGNPQALLAMRDFAARAIPQVEVLRSQVSAGSLPLVGELEALLQDSQQATARQLAACGPQCSAAAAAAGGSLSPSALPTTATGAPSTSSTSAGRGSGPGGIAVPSAPLSNQSTGGIGGVPAPGVSGPGVSVPGVSVPGVSVGTGGLGVGRSATGATLSTGGATINLPPVSVPVPVVTTTVTVPLPSVSLGTTGVHVSLPGTTLGSATIPGATLHLP
jgi:hypothetical protein